MRRRTFWSLAVFCGLLLGNPARGGLIYFDSRAAFDTATSNQLIIDFSGLAPDNGFSYYGNPGTLTVSGVTFASNGPLFVQNDGVSSRLTVQQGSPDDLVDVTPPAGTTAFGFDYIAGAHVVVTLANGDSYELGESPYPDYHFAGFVSDQVITSLRLESAGGFDLKRFTFGQAVPEPSSAMILGIGLLATLLSVTGFGRNGSQRRGG